MLSLNKIYCGDSEELLKKIDDKTVDLIVTSPPYSNLRSYGNTLNDWNKEKFEKIAIQLERVLKDGGVLVWNVNDKTEKSSKTGTSFRQCLYFMDNLKLNLNDTMIWKKTNMMPVVRQPRYNPCFEYMFVFSKGTPKTFNPIMIPCKCAGQIYDSTCKNMGGENGRTHKTFNINKEKVDNNIWEFAVAQNKTKHPAVFPYELPYRHIKTWTNENDLVLDPFMGSGTTAIASLDLKRNFIGIERNEEYCYIANERIKKWSDK